MKNAGISIGFVHSALKPLIDRDLDTEDLLRSAGIASVLLQWPHSRVDPQSFSILWLDVARRLDDELFGQDSRRMKVGSFAMLCRTLIQCATLKSALQCMARFFNLLLDDFRCSVESASHHARWIIQERPSPRQPRVFGHETLLIMQHGLACWLVGRRIPLLQAAFCYPELTRAAEYRRMYSDQLLFDQCATSLTFDRAYLDLPVIQTSGSLRDFVRDAPANIVLKYKNAGGLAAQIRRCLRAAALAEWPNFEVLAAGLHMTASTLRRRLDEEGQSFQRIKDQLRLEAAIGHLSDPAKTVADIAREVGFAETSAFHRAFKNWTGVNPGEYRQRCQTNMDRPGSLCLEVK